MSLLIKDHKFVVSLMIKFNVSPKIILQRKRGTKQFNLKGKKTGKVGTNCAAPEVIVYG